MSLEKFKARLTAKTKAAGVNLSKKRIDAYADRLHKKNPDVKDEDAEHDTLIDALDELVVFADVAKEDDQARTQEAKIKKLSEKKPDPKKEDDESDDEGEEDDDADDPKTKGKKKPDEKKTGRMPAWAKLLVDEVQSLKAEKSKAAIQKLIAEKLKGEDGNPKVPGKFYAKWALPEKEEEIDDFVAQVEADWAEINPGATEGTPEQKPTVNGHKPSRSSGKGEKVSDKDLDAIVSNIM